MTDIIETLETRENDFTQVTLTEIRNGETKSEFITTITDAINYIPETDIKAGITIANYPTYSVITTTYGNIKTDYILTEL